jgi:membrane-associated protease RseP (regulator of RpoE activity)
LLLCVDIGEPNEQKDLVVLAGPRTVDRGCRLSQPFSNPQGGNTAAQAGTGAQAATAGSPAPSARPASIGVSFRAASTDGRGIKLVDIVKNGPADQAGLRFGDLIIAVNNTPLGKPAELTGLLASFKPGTTITVTYMRKGEKKQSPVTMIERDRVFNKNTVGLTADAFRALAEQGDADAQLTLGSLYQRGSKGVPEDYAQAL